MDFLSSNSFLMLEKSAGFLWTKQAAITDNVANAETPNYKKKVVTFEESLRGKLKAASSGIQPKKNGAYRAGRLRLRCGRAVGLRPDG